MFAGLRDMLLNCYRFYFPSVPVDIPLACQRTQARRRLEGEVEPGWKSMFLRHDRSMIGGRVTADKVNLYFSPAMSSGNYSWGNSFRPILFASFEPGDGGWRLRGHFTVHPFMQVFFSVWMLLLFAITVYILFMMLFGSLVGVDESMPPGIPLMALALFGGGTFLARWGWQSAADEIAIIERFVRERVGPAGE